ncbi:PucR family transcriptional regulator [Streptomyces sp. NPDC007083]|uniref:PucR family transcriptional regulator n=1 Tax=unclassified Streptomyces TaxID=2593676 RepID=UPI0034040667
MAGTEQFAVPLSTLLGHPALGLTRIAGPAEDRLISTVGTTEVEDPVPYLVGGELLLTAGVRLPSGPEGIEEYVSRVAAAGVAALGFGVAPVHQEVPAELAAACDRHGLPLLRLPPRTPFVAVGQAVYDAIAEVRNSTLRRISTAQSALASAAARPDALGAVLQQLSAHTEAASVLFDAQGNELFAAGRRPPDPGPRLLRELAVRTLARSKGGSAQGRPAPPAAAAHHHAGVHLTVHTLPGADGAAPLALGQAADAAPTPVHRQVTGTATVLLSLLTSPSHALGADTRGVGALVRLMLGAAPAEVAHALLPDDGPGGADHWVVVHGRRQRSRPGPEGRASTDPAQLAALGTALGTPYLHLDRARLRALVPSAPGARPSPPARAAALGWTLGFSSPVPAAELPGADAQAERALERAVASEASAVVHSAAHTLHSLVSAHEAREHARARFAPLSRAPAPGAAVLLGTLRTWLAFHGTWDRTAAELRVHRNTVRHRLARVAELLDVDLQDPEVRMELWFALRWLPDDAAAGPRGSG